MARASTNETIIAEGQKRLAALQEEYRAVSDQLIGELDAVKRKRLEEQLRQIEPQMTDLEEQLRQYKIVNSSGGPASLLPNGSPVGTFQERDWLLLLSRIKAGKCTPFIGPDTCPEAAAHRSEHAQRWAQKHGCPIGDHHDVAQVTQYIAVTMDRVYPRELMVDCCAKLPPPDFADPDEPHRVLAGLPLPLYITTNHDAFMSQALQHLGKRPKQELCRWNEEVRDYPSALRTRGLVVAPSTPVVFHAYGYHREGERSYPESLVLTEDDYLEFLANVSKDPDLFPSQVQKAVTSTTLLFLGYSINDWGFRVLLRSLRNYLRISLARTHVAVQLAPGDGPDQGVKDAVRQYLDRYFAQLDTHVYWGTCHEFAAELRKRWEASEHEPER